MTAPSEASEVLIAAQLDAAHPWPSPVPHPDAEAEIEASYYREHDKAAAARSELEQRLRSGKERMIHVPDDDPGRLTALEDLLGLVAAEQNARAADPDRHRWEADFEEVEARIRGIDRTEQRLAGLPAGQNPRLVTGPLRTRLSHWLVEARGFTLTGLQREALGDLDQDATVADAKTLLAGEGFEAEPLFEGDLLPGIPLVLMWHRGGMLAEILPDRWNPAVSDGPAERRFGKIRVYYAAALLDPGLGAAGIGFGNTTCDHGEDGRGPTRFFGRLCYAARYTGSLRAQLAALRTFADLITPWPQPLAGAWLGGEPDHHLVLGTRVGSGFSEAEHDQVLAAYQDASRRLAAGLPADVRALLGPIVRPEPDMPGLDLGE